MPEIGVRISIALLDEVSMIGIHKWEQVGAGPTQNVTELKAAIMKNPDLRGGLLDGTITLDYRLVRGTATGKVTTVSYQINLATVDLAGWLA